MGAAEERGVGPGRRADSERGRRGYERCCRSLRRCGSGFGTRSRGGRAGGVRGCDPPEQAPVQAPPVPDNFSSPAPRARRARRRSPALFVLLPFLRSSPATGRRWRSRGSGARPHHPCAGGFFRTILGRRPAASQQRGKLKTHF